MRKTIWIAIPSLLLLSLTSFGRDQTPRVTGIGGVFFKATGDRQALAAWYEKHLGLKLEPWGGSILRWPEDTAEDKGVTVHYIASKDTQFSANQAPFMINYRVNNLDGLIANLKKEGIELVKGPESDVNGKFAWIEDPEGNRIELWEPKAFGGRKAAAKR
jgi:predicted enzyme related to lactoylglutathione lyase